MSLNTEVIFQKLINDLNDGKEIKLIEVFPEELNDGKLFLNNIDFFRFGPNLKNIDFANCVISNCDFSFLTILNCDFTDAEFKQENKIENTYVSDPKNFFLAESSPEDWDKEKNRFRGWYKKILATCPEDLFNYDELAEKYSSARWSGSKKYVETEDGFFVFTDPALESYDSTLGRKLHVSVAPENLKKVFHLIAPYIAKYCPIFKVINLDVVDKQDQKSLRLYEGAQITIYLEVDDKPLITLTDVTKMIDEVSAVLDSHEISVGKIPKSDEKTVSKYFSTRDDKILIPESFFDKSSGKKIDPREYIPAEHVGGNSNPSNSNNPYKSLLLNQKAFDLLTHFTDFAVKDSQSVQLAVVASMLACLNEYTNFNSLTEEKMSEFKKQCFDYYLDVDNEFLKEAYHNEVAVKHIVKMAILCLDYFYNANIFSKLVFFNISECYRYEDHFSKVLSIMENQFKLHTSNKYVMSNVFSCYLLGKWDESIRDKLQLDKDNLTAKAEKSEVTTLVNNLVDLIDQCASEEREVILIVLEEILVRGLCGYSTCEKNPEKFLEILDSKKHHIEIRKYLVLIYSDMGGLIDIKADPELVGRYIIDILKNKNSFVLEAEYSQILLRIFKDEPQSLFKTLQELVDLNIGFVKLILAFMLSRDQVIPYNNQLENSAMAFSEQQLFAPYAKEVAEKLKKIPIDPALAKRYLSEICDGCYVAAKSYLEFLQNNSLEKDGKKEVSMSQLIANVNSTQSIHPFKYEALDEEFYDDAKVNQIFEGMYFQ